MKEIDINEIKKKETTVISIRIPIEYKEFITTNKINPRLLITKSIEMLKGGEKLGE